jgi:hypothetical protein
MPWKSNSYDQSALSYKEGPQKSVDLKIIIILKILGLEYYFNKWLIPTV